MRISAQPDEGGGHPAVQPASMTRPRIAAAAGAEVCAAGPTSGTTAPAIMASEARTNRQRLSEVTDTSLHRSTPSTITESLRAVRAKKS
jgi:hypothetical protein